MFENLDINLLLTTEFWKRHVDSVIFVVLGLMSLIMLWRTLERYIFYKRINVLDYPNIHLLNIALEKNLTTIYTVQIQCCSHHRPGHGRVPG